MIRIGITGGIGSGKSEVSKLLKKAGIPIIPADLLARHLINRDEQIKSALIKAFGPDIYQKNDTLDRKKVAEIVFQDKSAKAKIDQIVHPRVIKYEHKILDKLAKSGKFKIAGIEAALIYEAGSEKFFDFIIVVNSSKKTVIDRLKIRDELDESAILQRIQAQMDPAQKEKMADYVIKNDGSLHDLKNEVSNLLNWLEKKATNSSSK